MMRYILLLVVTITSFSFSSELRKPYQLREIGVTNNVGTVISKDVFLSDNYDKKVNLRDLVNAKPTIINFVYLNCPLLCHLHLDGILDVVKESKYRLFEDYQIVTISIDPKESNKNLSSYKDKYNSESKTNNGWHFLKGDKQTIKEITKQLGYGYKYIKRTKDYSHPAVIFFYNKKLTNYIEGVMIDQKFFDFSIMTLKVDKSLKEKLITYCYYFDPDSQTYSMLILKY